MVWVDTTILRRGLRECVSLGCDRVILRVGTWRLRSHRSLKGGKGRDIHTTVGWGALSTTRVKLNALLPPLGAPQWGEEYPDGIMGGRTLERNSYLVDPASSHMLVSKIKPCMSKYKQLCTVKLRMAHYISYSLLDSTLLLG